MKRIIWISLLFSIALGLSAQDTTDSKLPEGYDAWSIDQKIDWLIENLPMSVKLEQMNTAPRGMRIYQQNKTIEYNLPGFVSCDGPRGVHRGNALTVCFPVALGMAASWDPALFESVGAAFSDQLKSMGANQVFAPGLNVIRHPLAGRNAEYFGEDPFLSGKLGAAEVRGIQKAGCLATPKHLACNPFETGRFRVDVTVPERVMREIYLEQFRIAVQEGGALSVMTAYNSVNGHFASANRQILDILYNEWGFRGYVVSDYNAEMESAAAAMIAGTHVEMPGWRAYSDENVRAALEEGALPGKVFDDRLRKILEIKLDSRLYDPAEYDDPPLDLDAQRALARRAAREGMVLLKNRHDILPLRPDQTVALIGPFADSELILGNQGSSTTTPERFISAFSAFKSRIGDRVNYLCGCNAKQDGTAVPKRAFACQAEYFNNPDLKGEPVCVRDETEIRHLSWKGPGGAFLADGVKAKAYGFNGQTMLRTGVAPQLSLHQDFTWNFWVFLPDQFPDRKAPFMNAFGRHGFRIEFMPGEVFVFNREPRSIFRMEMGMDPLKWNLVTLMRMNDTLKVMVDGRVRDAHVFPYCMQSFPVVAGGSEHTGKTANCLIDDITIYDRALSASEITAILNKEDLVDGRIYYDPCEAVAVSAGANNGLPGIANSDLMSARWTGSFTAEKSGLTLFHIVSNGGIRFYINGEKMIDQWQEAWVEGTIREWYQPFEAGETAELTIEYSNFFGRQRGKDSYVRFEYFDPEPVDPKGIAEFAASRDVAVVVVGVPQRPFQGEADDHEFFLLPGYQDRLIRWVADANPNTVVILCSAGGVDMRSWIEAVPGVVEAFFPGQEAGYALTDVLYGDVNFSGKLPVTYARSLDQLEVDVVQPVFENTVCGIGYRMFDKREKEPLFPFGHGLSYTEFKYSKLKVKKRGENQIIVRFNVKNTGKRSGAEIAQIYVGDVECTEERPVRELKGFEKVWLEPGESKTVEVALDRRAFSFFSEAEKKWGVEPGKFQITLGGSSRDIRLRETISLK